jgi:hypothetical protein
VHTTDRIPRTCGRHQERRGEEEVTSTARDGYSNFKERTKVSMTPLVAMATFKPSVCMIRFLRKVRSWKRRSEEESPDKQ